MSELTCFTVTVVGQVAHVVMSRGDALNTLTPAFWRELPQVVGELSDRGDIRVIVLSSTGKHFTAGMDLAVFTSGSGTGASAVPAELGRQRAALRQSALTLQEAISSLERARVPVLTAIQGGCVGGGVDLVSASDMRYATRDAFFCVQETNIAMTADLGTLQRLPKIIPDGIAREMAYRGLRLPAERAFQIGLVNEVFDDHDEMIEGVMEVAHEIAGKSPLAVWGTKEMLNYARDHSVADGLNYIATWQAGMFQPGDMAEYFSAKVDQRDPAYDDLLPTRRDLG